jgi:uncharacterized protein YyaL (SSP411 family)
MPTNRLAAETSPYLLQHAHNPVDWYPWGAEAFEKARKENKAIFLSVGYSTCYWCHVMERQSFENTAIAAEMNRRFVNIKVDREERPDVDQLYMNAVQVLTGHGGWPMSVFLMPDLKPFYGGTYYPPSDMHGRIGFPRLLAAVDDAWHNRREEVDRSAAQILDALHRMAQPATMKHPITIDSSLIEEILDRSTSDYDPHYGGFGSAPKFPRETLLELVFASQHESPNPTRLEQVLYTLDAMAQGGIRDHLGGAFHRYSTDEKWLVPHFEIMLYDNAMLAKIYAEAFAQTKQVRYANIARGILDFVLREMTSDRGAFYTAFDAEVDAQEGLSYLWTESEISQVLGAEAESFCHAYGVDLGPNFADPHHGTGAPDKNILYLPESIDEKLDRQLAPLRQKLYEHRRKRKQPLLDTKILTSWNALMISALAHAGKVLHEPRYSMAAMNAADYLLHVHRTSDGGLFRVSRDGHAKGEAFLDDYAFLAQALLDCGRKNEAQSLADQMCQKFLDQSSGGFFFTAADSAELIVRQKTASDSPLPSGTAIAADVMRQLGKPQIARDTIAAFAGQIERYGEGMSSLVQAAFHYVNDHGPITLHSPSPGTPGEGWGEGIVKMTANWKSSTQLDVTIDIADGYHINASQTIAGLIPTRLAIVGSPAAAVDYPPAALRTLPFADEPIPIYEGQITVVVRFSQLASEPVTISLQYQACDESTCQSATTCRLTIAANEVRDG